MSSGGKKKSGNPAARSGGGRVTPKLKPQERKCRKRSLSYGRDMPHLMSTLTTTSSDGSLVRTEEICNWCGSGWSRT